MKVPYSWLKEYINIENITPEEVAKKLTLAGSEISSIDTTGGDIPGVVIGKVISTHKHPDSEKLTICKVDIGEGTDLSIVCGAKNVAPNIYVPVAKVGSILPSGDTIKKATILGFESNGMICSKLELGFNSDGEDGIWIFEPENVKIGQSLSSLVSSTDYVLNVEVTANRGDILSIVGFARECSLILEKRITMPSIEEYPQAGGNVDITIENTDSCLKYVARIIEGVEIAPSPDWMQNRLKMCGINPINNIVDATNYVMLEYGQPLHAFDADKIASRKIIVRSAIEGEKLVLLNDSEVTLTANSLVIADPEKALALAGVMGGAYSAISDTTKNILIESAYFDAIAVRKSSSITGIKSDSSYRFERGIDHTLTLKALNRVVELVMLFNKSAKIISRAKEVNAINFEPKHIVFNCDLVSKVLSLPYNRMEIASILKKYGFNSQALGGNSLKVDIPPHRHDLNIAVDLLEEIARIEGYNNLKTTLPKIRTNPIKTDYRDISKIKHLMSSYGFYETKQYSMNSSLLHKKLGMNEDTFIKVITPLSTDLDILRPTSFASMLSSISYNQSRRNKSGSLFEVGSIFYKKDDSFVEEKRLSAALFGYANDKRWNEETRVYDFFDLSGVLEDLLSKSLRADNYKLEVADFQYNWFVPTECANVSIFNKVIGFVGKVHPRVLKMFDITGDVYYFDIDLKYTLSLVEEHTTPQIYKETGKYPSVNRDLALICSRDIVFANVLDSIKEVSPIIQNVYVVDRYAGEKIDSSKVSIAISIIYNDTTKTLKEDEIVQVENNILTMLKTKFDIELRTV